MKRYSVSFTKSDGSLFREVYEANSYAEAQAEALEEAGAKWLILNTIVLSDGYHTEIFIDEIVEIQPL
jgi:hypothetical protein